MEHRANQGMSSRSTLKWRGMLLVFVSFAYLFVGLAHTVGCSDHAFAGQNQLSIDGKVASDDGLNDSNPEPSKAASHHCYVCAPAQLTALAAIAVPSGHSVTPAFLTVTFQLADLSRLDLPPPRV